MTNPYYPTPFTTCSSCDKQIFFLSSFCMQKLQKVVWKYGEF